MAKRRRIETNEPCDVLDYEKFKKTYLYNKSCYDTSDMYRMYYARIRMNVYTNKNYVKFIKNEIVPDSYDDIATYLTYGNWAEESDYPDSLSHGTIEEYAKHAHSIAMKKIHQYRACMVCRINNVIIRTRHIIYSQTSVKN